MTAEEYIESYVPAPGWLLVAKDVSSDKVGRIYVPEISKRANLKFASTGVIVAKSPVSRLESEWDTFIYSLSCVGDRVGFSSMVPHLSPAPTTLEWTNPEGKEERHPERLVTLHAADILVWFCGNEKDKARYLERVKR
jgi:hypothetical protein